MVVATISGAWDAHGIRSAERRLDVGYHLPGIVEKASDGGREPSIRYRNPGTAQDVRLDVAVSRDALRPDRGDIVMLDVDRTDPDHLRLAGDRTPLMANLLVDAWAPGIPFLVWLRRLWFVRRTRRLVGRTATSFAMIGAIAPPRLFGRRCELHLYPLDAAPGGPSVCAVPLLTTAGQPLVTHAFPVEVKGSPRPIGHVIARSHGTMLWPASRAYASGRLRRPKHHVGSAQRRTCPEATEFTVPPESWLATPLGLYVGAVVGALVIAVIAIGVTTKHRADAVHLMRTGQRVVVQAVAAQGTYALKVRYTDASGKSVVSTAPVDLPGAYTIGRRYPSVVDPADPTRLRLLAEPYDSVQPLVWSAVPLILAIFLLGRQLLARRSVRRVARAGPWRPVDAVAVDGWHLALRPAGSELTLCTVAVPEGQMPPNREPNLARLEAAGSLMPGEFVAVRGGDTEFCQLAPAGAARALLGNEGRSEPSRE